MPLLVKFDMVCTHTTALLSDVVEKCLSKHYEQLPTLISGNCPFGQDCTLAKAPTRMTA